MCNRDLDLEALLADPLIRLVMSSDGVEEADIRQLAKHAGLRRAPGRVGEPDARRGVFAG